jgi:hypothetical protein
VVFVLNKLLSQKKQKVALTGVISKKKTAEGPMLWRTEESADDLVCQ